VLQDLLDIHLYFSIHSVILYDRGVAIFSRIDDHRLVRSWMLGTFPRWL
jgi:hypothetical protein